MRWIPGGITISFLSPKLLFFFFFEIRGPIGAPIYCAVLEHNPRGTLLQLMYANALLCQKTVTLCRSAGRKGRPGKGAMHCDYYGARRPPHPRQSVARATQAYTRRRREATKVARPPTETSRPSAR